MISFHLNFFYIVKNVRKSVCACFPNGLFIPAPEFVPPPEPTEEEAQEQTAPEERIYTPDGRIYYQFDQLLKDERDKKRKNGENVLSVVGEREFFDFFFN